MILINHFNLNILFLNFDFSLFHLISESEIAPTFLSAAAGWVSGVVSSLAKVDPTGIVVAATSLGWFAYTGYTCLNRTGDFELKLLRRERYYKHLEQEKEVRDFLRSFDDAKPYVNPGILKDGRETDRFGAVIDLYGDGTGYGIGCTPPHIPPTGPEWIYFIVLLILTLWLIYECVDFYFKYIYDPRKRRRLIDYIDFS